MGNFRKRLLLRKTVQEQINVAASKLAARRVAVVASSFVWPEGRLTVRFFIVKRLQRSAVVVADGVSSCTVVIDLVRTRRIFVIAGSQLLRQLQKRRKASAACEQHASPVHIL